MAALLRVAKVILMVAGLRLEVGTVPVINGQIDKDVAFAEVLKKVTNTRGGEFDICQKNNIVFEQSR